MRLLADENIEAEIILALRHDGFDVTSVREISPGIDDESVLKLANEVEAVLITNDKDFGELVYRDRLWARGIILLRFETLVMPIRIERIKEVLKDRIGDLENSFTTISDGAVRIRTSYLS